MKSEFATLTVRDNQGDVYDNYTLAHSMRIILINANFYDQMTREMFLCCEMDTPDLHVLFVYSDIRLQSFHHEKYISLFAR